MTVPVEVKRSPVHGMGIFAVGPIRRGTVVWQFSPGLDRVITDYVLEYNEPRVAEFIRERGYINPNKKGNWILPSDEAQFWNFPPKGEQANIELGGLQDGEYLLLAARDIALGEELFVPPESDADYERKMQIR